MNEWGVKFKCCNRRKGTKRNVGSNGTHLKKYDNLGPFKKKRKMMFKTMKPMMHCWNSQHFKTDLHIRLLAIFAPLECPWGPKRSQQHTAIPLGKKQLKLQRSYFFYLISPKNLPYIHILPQPHMYIYIHKHTHTNFPLGDLLHLTSKNSTISGCIWWWSNRTGYGTIRWNSFDVVGYFVESKTTAIHYEYNMYIYI